MLFLILFLFALLFDGFHGLLFKILLGVSCLTHFPLLL